MNIERDLVERLFQRILTMRHASLARLARESGDPEAQVEADWARLAVDDADTDEELIAHIRTILSEPD